MHFVNLICSRMLFAKAMNEAVFSNFQLPFQQFQPSQTRMFTKVSSLFTFGSSIKWKATNKFNSEKKIMQNTPTTSIHCMMMYYTLYQEK